MSTRMQKLRKLGSLIDLDDIAQVYNVEQSRSWMYAQALVRDGYAEYVGDKTGLYYNLTVLAPGENYPVEEAALRLARRVTSIEPVVIGTRCVYPTGWINHWRPTTQFAYPGLNETRNGMTRITDAQWKKRPRKWFNLIETLDVDERIDQQIGTSLFALKPEFAVVDAWMFKGSSELDPDTLEIGADEWDRDPEEIVEEIARAVEKMGNDLKAVEKLELLREYAAQYTP